MTDDVHSYLSDLGSSSAPLPDPEFATHLELELRSMRAAVTAPRYATQRRWPATVAAVTFSVAVIAFGFATVDRGPQVLRISAASGASVFMPDGEVVPAEPGLVLPEGSRVSVPPEGGSASFGDIDLVPGQVAEITAEGVVLSDPDVAALTTVSAGTGASAATDGSSAAGAATATETTGSGSTVGGNGGTSVAPAAPVSTSGTTSEPTTTEVPTTTTEAPTTTESPSTTEDVTTTTEDMEPASTTTVPDTVTTVDDRSSTTTDPDRPTTTDDQTTTTDVNGSSTTIAAGEETTTTTTNTTTTTTTLETSTTTTTTEVSETTLPPTTDPMLGKILGELMFIVEGCNYTQAAVADLAQAVADGLVTAQEAAAILACEAP